MDAISGPLGAALLTAVLAGLAGLATPRLIAAIPEPDADADADADAEPKERYADIAGVRWLGPLAGVASAAAGGLVGWSSGWSWQLVVLGVLVPVGVALAVVDWRTMLLPTRVIAPTYGVVIAVVLLGWLVTGDTDDLVRAGWGWLIAGGLFLLLWLVHPRGMGYGDVRLSGVLGIALGYAGWPELLLGVYAGFLLGGVIGGLLAVLKVVKRRAFPFGPFMLVGALVGVAVGGMVSIGW